MDFKGSLKNLSRNGSGRSSILIEEQITARATAKEWGSRS